MTPTPGGVLDRLNTTLTDPLLQIVARLGKSPSLAMPDKIALADIVECDFPGYEPFVIEPTMEMAIDDPAYGEVDPTRVRFVAGPIVTKQQVTCLYVTKTYNGVGTSLIQTLAFPVPMVVNEEGQVIEFDVNIGAYNFDD